MEELYRFPSRVFKLIIIHSIWPNPAENIGLSKLKQFMHFQECNQFFFFVNQLNDSLFVRYKEAASQPALWLQQSLNTFRESLLDLCQPNRASAHAPLERSPPHQTSTPTNDNNLNANSVLAAQTKQIMDNLMTSCVVLRIENFTLYRVTTSGKKQMPKEFISGEGVKNSRNIHNTYICV